MTTPRARDLGLPFPGTPGPQNAITDVPGVLVGFTTLTDPARSVRTGVTAIVPCEDVGDPRPVWAGQFSLNGNGEMTGTHWINDAGYFIGPVCITNTHSVGMVHHGAVRWMIDRYADYFRDEHAWAMPVVAETYDGVLNDINGQHITADHAIAALDSAASGPVPEGSVGALVRANHGIRPWLTILGKRVGEAMPEGRLLGEETGSIIVILATDAPLSGLSLRQTAKRAAIGVGRGGSPGGNNSGDIFLAFSVANPQPMPQKDGPLINRAELNTDVLDPFYLAAVEAIEEAVVNSLVSGVDVATVKPRGRVCHAIDLGRLKELFA